MKSSVNCRAYLYRVKAPLNFLLAVALSLLILASCGCTQQQRISETRPSMGTEVTITVIPHGKARELAEEAIGEAFMEIARIESIFSTYVNTSEVYILNSHGTVQNASWDMLYLTKASIRFSELSRGAFDPTVEPLLRLYTRSFREYGRMPDDSEIKEALGLVGFRRIKVSGNTISLAKRGMALTFGGIAKGYAVDNAARVLEQQGFTEYLINAGGDLRISGRREDGRKWVVALLNPRNSSDYITMIEGENISVATSGDYERYYDESRKAHHIMDPATGYSGNSLISATIIAGDAMTADALATSVFVLGPGRGMALIEQLDGTEGLLITSGRQILRSTGFSSYEI